MMQNAVPTRRTVLTDREVNVLDQTIEALSAGGDALVGLQTALIAGGDGLQAALVVATTAALDVFQTAASFLEAVAEASRQPPARYRVTCPECDSESITAWTDILPPGGLSPVVCAQCGYLILSESEGDPVLIQDGEA